MSVSDYSNNVGEIVLRKDECFWIFPSEYINSAICSPWFSYMREKWRLIKLKVDSRGNFTFRVWRKCRSNPLRYNYTIQLSLRTTCPNQQRTCENKLTIKTGEPDPDYGCELKFFTYCYCSCGRALTHIVNQNGLVKLLFAIQKQDNINNATETSDEETSYDAEGNSSDEVGENSSDEHEESNEDEENSEYEKNSDEEDTSKNKSVVVESKGIRRLAENFKQIFLNGELSDVVLKVEDREFKVHKVVLAARSPVFAPMFKHDLTEKMDNVVNIPDCTAEAFEIFLHYLYCGSNETMSTSNVYNVYYAAHKYQVDDLKEECVKFMKKNLSLETFCDIIGLSLHHGESKLQKAATGFFCKNIKKILKTVQWQKYLAANPTHANELLIKAHNA